MFGNDGEDSSRHDDKFPSASRAWGEAHLLYTLMPFYLFVLSTYERCPVLPRDAILFLGGSEGGHNRMPAPHSRIGSPRAVSR